MTFKSTSERQSFTKRVASHSTKGRANGRVDVLPPEARENELLYAEAKSQFEAIHDQIMQTQKDLVTATGSRRDQLLQQLKNFRSAAGMARLLARAKGEKSYAVCFMILAEMRLSKELFIPIDEETERLMGRKKHEIEKPNNERRDRLRARFGDKPKHAVSQFSSGLNTHLLKE